MCSIFFFNDTATTEIYTLSLHDALPILRAALPANPHCVASRGLGESERGLLEYYAQVRTRRLEVDPTGAECPRSEEHTSELQSRQYLVCRLLLEKKTIAWSQHPAAPHSA